MAIAENMAETVVLMMPPERQDAMRKGWTFQVPDTDSTKFFIDKHCREHPLESLHEATLALFQSTQKKPK
jgi:hypothetical protein